MAERIKGPLVSKTLLLSPYPTAVENILRACGDEVVVHNDGIDERFVAEAQVDWIVSYGYRFILKGPLLVSHARRIVNLHISYLPYNGGADPNFWSLFDGTPRGVTIHFIDAGIDTGDILAQRLVELDEGTDTLATSYAKLHDSIVRLFAEAWPAIKANQIVASPPKGAGTYHRAKDKAALFAQLPDGYETPIRNVIAMGAAHRRAR